MTLLVLAVLAMIGTIAISAETEWRNESTSQINHANQ